MPSSLNRPVPSSKAASLARPTVDHFALFDSPTEELAALKPKEIIGGYYRQIGVVWNGGKSLVRRDGREAESHDDARGIPQAAVID